MMDDMKLVDAARELRLSYNQVHRLVLIGDLESEQDETGHWFVSKRSVARVAASLAKDRARR